MWITLKHQGPLVLELPSFVEPDAGQWIEEERNHYTLIKNTGQGAGPGAGATREAVAAELLQRLQSWAIVSQWRVHGALGLPAEQEPKVALDGGAPWQPQRARDVCRAALIAEAGTYLVLLTGAFVANVERATLRVGLGIGEPALLPSDPIAETALTLGALPSNCTLSQIVTLRAQQAVYAQVRLHMEQPISGVVLQAPHLAMQLLKID
jgi:hypothetical protein